jgi:predicted ATPase
MEDLRFYLPNKNTLDIANFGPIKSARIQIRKVTLFIGDQGTGKSTIAKVLATILWLEKSLVRGDRDIHYYTDNDLGIKRFKKLFDFGKIENYFNETSKIIFSGTAFFIEFESGRVNIKHLNSLKDGKKELIFDGYYTYENYAFPKIMYVPAERNFVTTLDDPNKYKNLPDNLLSFLSEYKMASDKISEIKDLPLNAKVSYTYNKDTKTGYIGNENYKIKLSESSSGYHSLIPLYLVTRYLSELTSGNEEIEKGNKSLEEIEKIRSEINKIQSMENISDEVRTVLIKQVSDKFSYQSFINIVEEPEQNLYPASQKKVLFDLLKYNNSRVENHLIMTTHSPYLIMYLSLAIMANDLSSHNISKNFMDKINKIVPQNSHLKSSDLIIYEMNEDGIPKILGDYKGLPTDENLLNMQLAETNDFFSQLLEIEDQL